MSSKRRDPRSSAGRRGKIDASKIAALGLIALAVPMALPVSPARAEIIQIPAVSFVQRETMNGQVGEAQNGTLTNAKGQYYAAVPFATNGARVCRFTYVYRDNDADYSSIAQLYKKPILVGGNPFDAPVLMAWVITGKATASAGVRKRSDNTITQPVIDLINAFYYVRIANGGSTLEVIGVQIDVRPSC